MQPIIAGEVFPEWYWGPIFLAVFVGFPLFMAALALDGIFSLVVRRRGGGGRSLGAHAKTVAALFAIGAALTWAVFAVG